MIFPLNPIWLTLGQHLPWAIAATTVFLKNALGPLWEFLITSFVFSVTEKLGQ